MLELLVSARAAGAAVCNHSNVITPTWRHCPRIAPAGAPWLRAAVMGINDGLVSTASLMLGVGAGAESLRAMQVCPAAQLRPNPVWIRCFPPFLSLLHHK